LLVDRPENVLEWRERRRVTGSKVNICLGKWRVAMGFDAVSNEDPLVRCWEELGVGAPTVSALALLASQALARAAPSEEGPELIPEARAILVASLPRGLLEIKAVNTAFETPERLLAVYVETEPENWRVFRDRRDPRYTIHCLEGFRRLCAAGLVIHHLYREFSLSSQGFLLADQLTVDAEMQVVLDRTVELS
jgi:hypothetical protein